MDRKIRRKSIFRSLFVPMIVIMVVQSLLFYIVAMYGGLDSSLRQNAVDILCERTQSRRNDIEAQFNNRWTALDDCVKELNEHYADFSEKYGDRALCGDNQLKVNFLLASSDELIDTLRFSRANGIFLILNDKSDSADSFDENGESKYGLCIRDMDTESNYSGREDLLLERSPASIVDSLGCLLDSWWEAKYSFTSESEGDFFYRPLQMARQSEGGSYKDYAYFSEQHNISGSDPSVFSYSVALTDNSGFAYAVLGVELSVNQISQLLPDSELDDNDKGCYVLALTEEGADGYIPLVGSGALYNRCFGEKRSIDNGEKTKTGGFVVYGRDKTELYATGASIVVYNDGGNSGRSLVLLAMVESDSLFSYIGQIKVTLLLVSLFSLVIGVLFVTVVSKRFASPITSLAKRVRRMNDEDAPKDGALGRIGITEIDQLVDSIEELNTNVSRQGARSEFFSRMSHDMRTPMSAIISFSSPELLENADEKAKTDYLDKIHTSGEYLLGLINEVLDMTKIDNNKTELHMSAYNARELFATSVSMTEKLAEKRKVRFITSLKLPDTLTVMADEQHLSQIIMNLLSNAVKFTPENGEVAFTVETAGEGSERKLCIRVADTGIGMSEEFQKKLYTPFEQENENHEGTGLGLSIAKKLVELMGGSIACESRKNAGTTFEVMLPLTEADAQAVPAGGVKENIEAEKTDFSALKGKRILVCEDNLINTKIIEKLLSRVGIITDCAENGAKGAECFSGSAIGYYSAVLMDIRMPVMNGLDAAKAIRQMNREDAASVPIIAITADAFEEDAKSSLAAGMNAHLSKPIDPKKLYETLAKML